MKDKKSRDRTQYPNALCYDIGHSWQKTTSDLYRRCDRMGCTVAERLTARGWVRVEVRRRPRKKHATPDPVATLF